MHRASEVFAGLNFTLRDERISYSEPRFITIGVLDERMVVLVWTPRGEARRIISMRKANDREQAKYAQYLGRSG
ncbi:BrnT family toxin [Allopusillimonas ginsengisoli]|uniref:BrnT family toxin n=1 Tax=Allopusillimonas ginsengisoli TaxID=453575 RepID=UPI0028A14CBE